ncbi:MAG: SAM-dependent methyltransferase, partial [Campylobacterales bacterium]|nr:SAM-dependent methyltransferase [Campylobacterales bacterium]
MVTIIGNGVGDYDFSRIELDLSSFDKVVCYKDFKEDRENVLKLDYKETKKYLLDNGKDLNILYVVTGSPLFFSAGTLIGKALEKENIPYKIIDNQSSKSYILSHFGISESNCGVLSLHGRERVDLCELLAKEYTFVLCDEKSIGKLREVFCYLEPKDLRVYLGYKLGF